MGLNRTAAITYAKKYWNRACDDDVIWLLNSAISVRDMRRRLDAPKEKGWEAYFYHQRDANDYAQFLRVDATTGAILEYGGLLARDEDHLNDCTHYVSRCLRQAGLPIKETPRANELITTLMSLRNAKVLAEQVSHTEGQKIVDAGLMKPGDALGIFEAAKKRYGHSMIYTGPDNDANTGETGGITCHSNCRYGGLTQSWNTATDDVWYISEADGESYTLIHFTEDDPPLKLGPLYGWWQVEQRAMSWYCFVGLDGIAKSILVAPKSKHEHPRNATGDAKLVQTASGVVFVWKQTDGTTRVETWAAPMAGAAWTNVQTDAGISKATRLF